MTTQPKTILCLASFEKGSTFLRQAKAEGWRVMLLTGESCQRAAWPMEAIDELFFLPDPQKSWNLGDMVKAMSYLARRVKFDRIVALDDFDVEKAAMLREHLRVSGMGDTTARNFRDKLAMRGRAKDAGIPIPEFTGVFNDDEVSAWIGRVPAPWALKPRFQANAIGIKKCHTPEELWRELEALGDQRSHFLLEKFIEGDICHVDSVVVNKKVVFACASQYGTPPMEVFHGGRVFTTRTILPGTEKEKQLLACNQQIMTGLGLRFGVSHSEFILGNDGQIYFLETSARVAGANIAELVEFCTGVNLWAEWAKLECADEPAKVRVRRTKRLHGGLLVTLAQQARPDMSGYNHSEVVWKLNKPQHAGLILVSPSYERVSELLEQCTTRFYEDFFMRMPAADSAAQMS